MMLIKLFIENWQGSSYVVNNVNGPHEANYLKLDSSKARNTLNWAPKWNVKKAVKESALWYKAFKNGEDLVAISNNQIREYLEK